MKVLYVTTISSTMNFFPEHIKMLKECGATVELASNFSVSNKKMGDAMLKLECVQHDSPFSRSPLSKDNIRAYRELKQLLKDNHYDIVHTHTPNASAIVRLACRKLRKQGTRVYYTAHGFHFYKGAPLKNWLVYFPVEWLLSHVTDVLITINKEDYARAQKFGAKKVCYIPGVGLDFSKFDFELSEAERKAKRAELGVPEQAKLLVSVGELNRNKNHEVIIRALAKIGDPNIHYCIAGTGGLHDYLTALADELGIGTQVHLLGYRNDVAQIYKSADVCCFPSYREGLGMAALEGIACGIPVVAADNRGTRDIICDETMGVLCPADNAEMFAEAIREILADSEKTNGQQFGDKERTMERFSVENVIEMLREEIYQI